MINLPTNFELSITNQYEDMKGNTKYRKWAVWGSYLEVTQDH